MAQKQQQVEATQELTPQQVMVRGIVQTAFLARLQSLGLIVLEGKCRCLVVEPPRDEEYDAMYRYLQSAGLIPETQLSQAE